MYFPLAGILSQFEAFVVNGNIGEAIYLSAYQGADTEVLGTKGTFEKTLIETADTEVLGALGTFDPTLIEAAGAIAFGAANTITQITRIKPVERELQFVDSFIDLSQVETSDRFTFGAALQASQVLIIGASRGEIQGRLPTSQLIKIEIGSSEVRGNALGTTEISTIEQGDRELHLVPSTFSLLPSIKAEFLPGSPGYVPGVASDAVELIGFEAGYQPLPLPVGFLGSASEVIGVATAPEVSTTLTARNIKRVELAEAELKSTLEASYLTSIQIPDIYPRTALSGIYLSTIEAVVDNEIIKIGFGRENIRIETATNKVASTIPAIELKDFEIGEVWRNENPLAVVEVSQIESPEKEACPLPAALCLLASPYAAESAITKP